MMGGAQTMQRHARVRVLKAAAVSIPFVRFFERPSRDAKVREYLQSSLRTVMLAADDHDGGLGAFMVAAAEELARDAGSALVRTMHPRDAKALLETISVLETRAALDIDPDAYAQRTSGAALDAAVAACIPEIGSAFAFAESLCGRLVADVGLSLPHVRRSTSFADAVGASCLVDDIGPTLVSAVNLELPEFGFTQESLYSAPYLLAHELICHAGQGVLGPLPRLESGNGCAWSDGWMDCLAYDEAVGWLALQSDGPDWIAEGSGTIVMSAEQAHASRYRSGGLTPAAAADVRARRDAKAAWHEFVTVARRAGRSEDAALALRRRFALRCNAHNMSPEARQTLLVGLSVGLLIPSRSSGIIDSAEEFLETDDLGELRAALAI